MKAEFKLFQRVMNININVYNLHEDKWVGKGQYIGRPEVLGNPFVIGRDGNRKTILEKYKSYLWDIIKAETGEHSTLNIEHSTSKNGERRLTDALTARAKCCLRRGELADPDLRRAVWLSLLALLDRAEAGETLNLLCYCKPLGCHGDVMKAALEWLAQNRKR